MNCGTEQGWNNHKAANEPPCRWCQKAVEDPAPVVLKAPRQKVAKCGTEGGYRKHIRQGEPTCEDCRLAHNRDQRAQLRARNPQRPALRDQRPGYEPAKCGTPSGYQRHRRHGEDACEPCRLAANARRQQYAKQRRAKAAA